MQGYRGCPRESPIKYLLLAATSPLTMRLSLSQCYDCRPAPVLDLQVSSENEAHASPDQGLAGLVLLRWVQCPSLHGCLQGCNLCHSVDFLSNWSAAT